jgi:hypothetical protein
VFGRQRQPRTPNGAGDAAEVVTVLDEQACPRVPLIRKLLAEQADRYRTCEVEAERDGPPARVCTAVPNGATRVEEACEDRDADRAEPRAQREDIPILRARRDEQVQQQEWERRDPAERDHVSRVERAVTIPDVRT